MFYLCVFKLFITKAILGFHIQRRKFFGTIRREPGMHIRIPGSLSDVSHRARSRSTMLKYDLALFSLNRGLLNS